MDDTTRQRIQSAIEGNAVVLFMKGTKDRPQCGFSAQVVSILDSVGVDFASVNVLEDPAIRQGIKEYSDWPTIPQLYIRGEFVGGCDIVTEMHESGELEEKLGVKAAEVAPPKITISEAAARAFKEAIEQEGESVRLEVDARFNHALSIGPRQPSDIVVEAGGVTFLLDRASAKRANGVEIDFREGPQGPAFKIDNPNEPPRPRSLSVSELKKKLDAGERIELIDVRTKEERDIAHIAGSRLFDRDVQKQVLGMPKDTHFVLYCHHGVRSQQAAEFFVQQGFSRVYSLEGGIDAWSREIDPSVPRY